MEEPRQGKWGLWYANGSGHATREEALKSIQSKMSDDAKMASAAKESGACESAGAVRILLIMLAVVGSVWAGVSWWNSGKAERTERNFAEAMAKAERQDRMNALLRCQKAIASVAAYGNSNNPGHAPGKRIEGVNVWQFLWPQGSFHFKNGFGVDVPQWARCEVDVPTGRISRLMVTGREISIR
ncbi:hypothetical protein H0A73_05165 [Alcaligenaceae bacterium]|nr:hypothetical protein [Alcaligenaceae bacterium]